MGKQFDMEKRADEETEIKAFIDWQMSFKGNPTSDIARLIITSTTPEVRRKIEEKSLQHYYKTLKRIIEKAGQKIDYNFEELEKAYHYSQIEQAINGFFFAMIQEKNIKNSEEQYKINTLYNRAEEACKQARIKRPHLFTTKATTNDRESMISRRVLYTSVRKKIAVQELSYDAEDDNAIMQNSYPEYNGERLRVEGSISSLKRSITMESNLDSFMLKTFEPEIDTKFISKKLPRNDDGNEKSTVNEKNLYIKQS